jgi:hypothetical protein
MGDQLLPLPLTERTVHVCVDMQRIFSAEGPWPTPWMDRVLPVVAALANRHPERTVFTRFIPPERPDQMPGMWRRYCRRWRVATRAPGSPAAGVDAAAGSACPPATVIDKTAIPPSPTQDDRAPTATRSGRADYLGIRNRCSCAGDSGWTRLMLGLASSSCATQYAALLTKGHEMLMRLYHTRYTGRSRRQTPRQSSRGGNDFRSDVKPPGRAD